MNCLYLLNNRYKKIILHLKRSRRIYEINKKLKLCARILIMPMCAYEFSKIINLF